MADSSSNADELAWVSLRREYESFPLYLRYPTPLDFDALSKRLPIRLVLTHTFSFRRFDGAPEPRYNETLEEFDLFLTGYFKGSNRGQVVLVETFGGERNYYYYLSDSDIAEEFITALRDQFPVQRVESQYASDPEWRFIRRYRAEIIDAA